MTNREPISDKQLEQVNGGEYIDIDHGISEFHIYKPIEHESEHFMPRTDTLNIHIDPNRPERLEPIEMFVPF